MTTRDDSDQQTHSTPSPASSAAGELRAVACPFCGSHATELLSPFASQLSTSQYVCQACHTHFEYFRHEAEPGR
jgi:transposase-like protein